jgi:hypothetical protein
VIESTVSAEISSMNVPSIPAGGFAQAADTVRGAEFASPHESLASQFRPSTDFLASKFSAAMSELSSRYSARFAEAKKSRMPDEISAVGGVLQDPQVRMYEAMKHQSEMMNQAIAYGEVSTHVQMVSAVATSAKTSFESLYKQAG